MLEQDVDRPALTEAIRSVLVDRGPLTVAELADGIDELGFDLGADAEDEVLDELYESFGDQFTPLTGDRWAYLPALVCDRRFTHRLTDPEICHDGLTISPDLVAIYSLPEHSDLWRLVGGGDVTTNVPDWPEAVSANDGQPGQPVHESETLLLPAGTLAGLGVQPGNLVSLVITDHGVELTRVDQGDVRPHLDSVRQLLGQIVAAGKPAELEESVLSVCADVDEAFRTPHPPLTELFADLGLAPHGDWLAAAGFDFANHWAEVQVRSIITDYGLAADEAATVAALCTLHDRLIVLVDAALRPEGASDEFLHSTLGAEIERAVGASRAVGTGAPSVASLAYLLPRPEVAGTVLDKTLGTSKTTAEALAQLAGALEDQAGRASRPALRWLRAKAYESLGRVVEAEDELNAAERLDPSWPLTLLDLARYASDRGDAVRGLALLARADPYADVGLEELLRVYRPEQGPTMGRNEPCWCGSGRKFKQCHLHQTTAQPLAERAAWLYQKAGRFLTDRSWYADVAAVARERAAYAEDEKAIEAAITDPLVGDAVLFEGGVFAEFIEQRGHLLPADERLLADSWLLVDRSVFDVTAVRRGQGFTARDLRTGDVVEVRDRAASRSVTSGALICARVVPAGDTMQVFGGIEPVSLRDREALLNLLDQGPGPEELVAFLSRRFAPTSLVNTEGDPLVIREVVLTVSAPEVLPAALDQRYRRIEDTDQPEWIFERLIDGLDRICATLRLTGSQLHVSTNSDRRMDGVIATLREVDPGVTVASDERQPMTNTQEMARLAEQLPPTAGGAGGGLVEPEDRAPELQEALAEHIRSYEQQWLDLTIPALHGLTPREAAADPTRREDLVRLLASFGDDDGPTVMSARRLRAALGLEPGS